MSLNLTSQTQTMRHNRTTRTSRYPRILPGYPLASSAHQQPSGVVPRIDGLLELSPSSFGNAPARRRPSGVVQRNDYLLASPPPDSDDEAQSDDKGKQISFCINQVINKSLSSSNIE